MLIRLLAAAVAVLPDLVLLLLGLLLKDAYTAGKWTLFTLLIVSVAAVMVVKYVSVKYYRVGRAQELLCTLEGFHLLIADELKIDRLTIYRRCPLRRSMVQQYIEYVPRRVKATFERKRTPSNWGICGLVFEAWPAKAQHSRFASLEDLQKVYMGKLHTPEAEARKLRLVSLAMAVPIVTEGEQVDWVIYCDTADKSLTDDQVAKLQTLLMKLAEQCAKNV
jgi:hypothetical protein